MELKKLLNVGTTPAASVEMQQGKQSTETYQQWGHRMAGLSAGSVASLDPHLQIVYTTIKKEQENDAMLQDQLQKDIQRKIANENTALAQEKNNLDTSNKALKGIKDKISDITERISDLKNSVKKKNSEAIANLAIGLFILIPLTVYLFIFYSSTAYSAFFKEIDYTQALSSHMFDAQAFTNSWSQSWTAGMFIILITFIFMALGFILHQFMQQDGYAKYVKSTSIIIVTFVFDTLLAFMIAKNMYDAESLTMIEERAAYTLSMAFMDVHFWVVIFCGFLAYVIWGLLFGFVMDSYNKLDLNKVERVKLEKQLSKQYRYEKIEEEKNAEIINKITAIEGRIAALETETSTLKRYDTTAILLELNNFFSGWLHYMNAAAKTSNEITNAQNEFNTFINIVK